MSPRSEVVVAAWNGDWRLTLVSLGGGLLAGATFWVLNAATRGAVGFGDVKLAAVVGFAMGSASLGTVWFSVLIGSLIALIWMRWRRQSGPVPFGPMLLIGAWMALLLTGV